MASRTIRFENGFNGELLLDEGSVKIGRTPGGAAPYDMLYGALASCLYATFLGILEKKRIEIEDAVRKSFDLATKYCSVYQTISHVAEMSYELHFA